LKISNEHECIHALEDLVRKPQLFLNLLSLCNVMRTSGDSDRIPGIVMNYDGV
jgi:hypothetical protein